jgi:lysophospholipase L1-like esterase
MKRIRNLLHSKKPVKWLFYGDSISHGALHTFGWRDYTELFSERVRFELSRVDDIVIKTAFSGNTTRDLLASFDWRVKQFDPQAVFIMIGMNDCAMGETGARVPLSEFRTNLLSLVQSIRQISECLPVLQTSNPVLPSAAPEREPYLDAYMETIRNVAECEGVPLIDHGKHWKMETDGQPSRLYSWMNDPIHPNAMGHRVFSELIFKEAGILDQQSCTCRLFHP